MEEKLDTKKINNVLKNTFNKNKMLKIKYVISELYFDILFLTAILSNIFITQQIKI